MKYLFFYLNKQLQYFQICIVEFLKLNENKEKELAYFSQKV